MSGEDIVFVIVMWVVIGVVGSIILGGLDSDGAEVPNKAYPMMIFWPVTLPILTVFGVIYAIVQTFKTCINWFKE